MDPASSLESRGALGRLVAPVEAEYHRWLALRLMPLGTAAALASILSWFIGPPLAHLTVADSVDLSAIYLVAWCVTIPVLGVGLAWIRRHGGTGLVPFSAPAICLRWPTVHW